MMPRIFEGLTCCTKFNCRPV